MIRDEVYRIGREAIIDAFRRPRGDKVEVGMKYAARDLRVTIHNNGCGTDMQLLRSGRDGHFGLSGMGARAERIGARLKAWGRSAWGTEVEFSIPGNMAFRIHAFRYRRPRRMIPSPRVARRPVAFRPALSASVCPASYSIEKQSTASPYRPQ